MYRVVVEYMNWKSSIKHNAKMKRIIICPEFIASGAHFRLNTFLRLIPDWQNIIIPVSRGCTRFELGV